MKKKNQPKPAASAVVKPQPLPKFEALGPFDR